MEKNNNTGEHQDQVLERVQVPHWLQRLKDESWEAELLVSAIAIFGTFQLFKVVDWTTNFFIDWLPSNQHLIGYFIVTSALLAVSILVSMFVIHFFLRAYWVGLVGLNSVYPDYGLEDSAYSKIYTERILAILPKLKDSIHKVDQLCSVIFSVAFCLLLIYFYLAITCSLYLFLFNLLSDYVPKSLLLIPIGALVGFLIFQTLFGVLANLKAFKEKRRLQTFYFKTVKLGSILMFGPLYKYLLQVTMTFGSNFKKNKAMVGMILLFFLSGMFVSIYKGASSNNIVFLVNKDRLFDATKTYAGFYESENYDSSFLLGPEIQSDIIDDSLLKIFIPIYENEKRFQRKHCGTFEKDTNLSDKKNSLKIRSQYLDCYHRYNHVLLNGTNVNPDYLKYYHPRTNQFGLICYVQKTNMVNGKNVLEVKKSFGDDTLAEWTILFYYVSKAR